MSDAPEIAPEIRGLLEEIVADQRSSIRLVPRRALRSWFERGEPVRAREVATTRAERHLIEAHREALGELLREAARIAYYKAPILTHRPTGADGKPCDPPRSESHWKRHTNSILARTTERSRGVDLLRACLDGMDPRMAHSLGAAALALVPSDLNRFLVAFTVPWDRPHTSIALLGRLASVQERLLRYEACLHLGARWCAVGTLSQARDRYREAASFGYTNRKRFYAFHLSCYMQDQKSALIEAAELSDVRRDDPTLVETVAILRQWCATRPMAELRAARSFVDRLSGLIPDSAEALFEAYPS